MNAKNFVCIGLLAATLTGCASSHVTASTQPKAGFSNITDIPIPQSAHIDLSKSMVMGGNEKWTGHLVYHTNQPQPQVIDFLNDQMQSTGWTKVSELRGTESVLTFIKQQRIATVRIFKEAHYLSKDAVIVTVDMTNSKMKSVMLDTPEEEA